MTQLIFTEVTVTGAFEDKDGRGNTVVRLSTEGAYCNTMVNLYPYDVENLSKILGCDILKVKGKKLIGVVDISRVWAIGYQGMYVITSFPEYTLKDSAIVSESALCEMLECGNVMRCDGAGNVITQYKVPIQSEKTSERQI